MTDSDKTPYYSSPRVLAISGTDPSGGAGAAADFKSIDAAGGYAMQVTTAVVSQNTEGVRSVFPLPAEVLRSQLKAVADDVDIDAIKIGMLGNAETIAIVKEFLTTQPEAIVVLDPVMVATSGDRLLESDAEDALKDLVTVVDVVTPNTEELAILCGEKAPEDYDTALAMAVKLSSETGTAVILKKGHLVEGDAGNTWIAGEEVEDFPAPRIDTDSTHGTGCSLSSALAVRCCIDLSPQEALWWTTRWLNEAINYGDALMVGKGHGPVDHGHRARRLESVASTNPWVEYCQFYGDATTAETLFEEPSLMPPQALFPPANQVPETVASADTPLIEPAGPWTAALWNQSLPLMEAIMELPFIVGLGDGTLAEDDFAFYLNQDVYYLQRYCRVLAHLGTVAGRREDQVAWIADAHATNAAELAMHSGFLGYLSDNIHPSPVTAAYTDYLFAAGLGDDYVVGAAAVLPCYWLYVEVGLRLFSYLDKDNNPFAAWIEEYGASEFKESVAACLARVEHAFEQASPEQRVRAAEAYMVASRHEYEFFDQAHRRDSIV